MALKAEPNFRKPFFNRLKAEQILEKVLGKITPSENEIRAEKKMSEEIVQKLKAAKGKHIDVLVCGSIARNTHLRGDRDIDIFVMFPSHIPVKEFEREGLRLGIMVFRGHKWEKAYSQHPYIRGNIRGFAVEIVPSYKVERAEMLQSAVDRSPFHNAYLLSKMTKKQQGEVRLMKQFLKGIKAYGAELKVSSVPGYVTELLIVKYGNFLDAISAISKWKEREVVDIEGHLKEEEALKKFDTPLVVVDPVDRNRNVAAALSLNQYSRIIAAARAFLRKPSENFFYPKKSKVLETAKVKKLVEKEGLIVVGMGFPKNELADVLWGQIRRLAKKIIGALQQKDFKVLRSAEWSDESNEIVFVFDLEANELEKVQKRIGPSVTNEKHSEEFLKTHRKPISGPRIEEGRWVVDIGRKHFLATEYIAELLKQLRKSEKAGIKKALNKKARILGNAEVMRKYKGNAEFREFFSTYLKGKEEFE